MYPFFRAIRYLAQAKTANKINLDDTSKLKMRVWLSDIDIYPELNNGRHLTMMDIGRYDFGLRIGLFKVLKANKWGLMVAGNFTRYRRRLLLFQSYTLETELVGYDERWFYFYQKTVRKNQIHSSALIRTAITSKTGLIPTKVVSDKLCIPFSPSIPEWVNQWISLHDHAPKI